MIDHIRKTNGAASMSDIRQSVVTLAEGDFRVSLEWIGEGVDGDYDEDDPEDEPLLRFEVEQIDNVGGFQYVGGTSYCTQLDARIPDEVKIKALRHILNVVRSTPSTQSLKHVCGRLSWLKADDFLK
jgi:hypothetical protein